MRGTSVVWSVVVGLALFALAAETASAAKSLSKLSPAAELAPIFEMVFYDDASAAEAFLAKHPLDRFVLSSESTTTRSEAEGGWQKLRHPNGTEYHCYVPQHDDIVVVNEAATAERRAREFDRLAVHKPLPRALQNSLQESMGNLADMCSRRTNDWWTYEVCWGQHVKQYHVAPTTDPRVAGVIEKEYYLGKGPRMHIDQGASEELRYEEHTTYGPYVASTFYNGTLCDLTGEERQTEVRLFCSESAPQQELVDAFSVTEPKTCQYVISWWSQHACLDWMRRPSGALLNIVCIRG